MASRPVSASDAKAPPLEPQLKTMRVKLEHFTVDHEVAGYIVEIPEEILEKTGTPAELDLSFAMTPDGRWTIGLTPADGKGLYSGKEAAEPDGNRDGGFSKS